MKRDYEIHLTDLTYDEARTLYAMLIGQPESALHDTAGRGYGTFSGGLALQDGRADGRAGVLMQPTKRVERMSEETMGRLNAVAITEAGEPATPVVSRAPILTPAADPNAPRAVKDVPQA